MNLKHAAALLLVAVGVSLLIVGGALAVLGIANEDAENLGMVGQIEAALPFVGLALLVSGIVIYRRSDHQIPQWARVSGPLMVLMVLATPVLYMVFTDPTLDWSHPKFIRLLLRLALLLFMCMIVIVAWVRNRYATPALKPAPANKTDANSA